jgi:hypothetical protein
MVPTDAGAKGTSMEASVMQDGWIVMMPIKLILRINQCGAVLAFAID